MPEMKGISVMREIKDKFPEIKILALTIHESDHLFTFFNEATHSTTPLIS
jgi:DNA-binding NarL/FixJ family response regulator